MKGSICVILLALVAAVASKRQPFYDLKDAEKLFEKFVVEYDRHYKSEQDRQEHFEAFKQSLLAINKLNAVNPNAVFDINEFADYTPEEIEHLHGFKPKRRRSRQY